MHQSSKRLTTSEQRDLLGRLGKLETRLANSPEEVIAAQKLRFKVFCEEMSAGKNLESRIRKRDTDRHDPNCDHLLVIDREMPIDRSIVGTQRFFLKGNGRTGGQFYSQQEFNVEQLLLRYSNKVFMELGRSCILSEYRSKRTMELMWQGTWAYAVDNKVDVMLGCASFHTENVDEISIALGFLSRFAPIKVGWDVKACLPGAISTKQFEGEVGNERAAMRSLPPLIKGYLRLGAMFSSQAVIDHEFGTIDVLVVLPVASINTRYLNYYGDDASKHRG